MMNNQPNIFVSGEQIVYDLKTSDLQQLSVLVECEFQELAPGIYWVSDLEKLQEAYSFISLNKETEAAT